MSYDVVEGEAFFFPNRNIRLRVERDYLSGPSVYFQGAQNGYFLGDLKIF